MTSNTGAARVNRVSKAILLIRILVGWVFLSEGTQKFLFPKALGVGRFVKIGIPWPRFMAPFVGVVEIVCGAFLSIGSGYGDRRDYATKSPVWHLQQMQAVIGKEGGWQRWIEPTSKSC